MHGYLIDFQAVTIAKGTLRHPPLDPDGMTDDVRRSFEDADNLSDVALPDPSFGTTLCAAEAIAFTMLREVGYNEIDSALRCGLVANRLIIPLSQNAPLAIISQVTVINMLPDNMKAHA